MELTVMGKSVQVGTASVLIQMECGRSRDAAWAGGNQLVLKKFQLFSQKECL